MDWNTKKCVIIVDEELPLGLIANTSMIMGLSLGRLSPELIGVDVFDKSHKKHLGITECPIPVLKADHDKIKKIRQDIYDFYDLDLLTIDFSDVAQKCISYDDFIHKMKEKDEDELQYLGVTIFGDKKIVNKLTGSLPLLR